MKKVYRSVWAGTVVVYQNLIFCLSEKMVCYRFLYTKYKFKDIFFSSADVRQMAYIWKTK